MNTFKNKVKRTSKVDLATGNISYIYSYNNKQCAVNEINSQLAKQYVAYDLINHDLECANDWIKQAYLFLPPRNKDKDYDNLYLSIDEKRKESLIMSLFISSITYYCKCFTQAHGRRVKLEKKFVPENYKMTHKKIMDFRNEIAAHSGVGDWDTGKLMLISYLEKDQNQKNIVWAELKMLSFFDDRDTETPYIQLINEVKTKVLDKIKQLGKLVLAE